MSVLAQRRKRRTMIAFCSGLAGLLLLPLLGFLSVDALRSSKEGRNALKDLPPLVRIPPTPGALMAVTDANGELTSMVVLALRPPSEGVARGGTIIVVPVGIRTLADDGTNIRVADAFATGGIDVLKSAVEGSLSVSLTRADVVSAAQLSELLAPLGDVRADLPGPLLDGETEMLPSGIVSLDTETLSRALSMPLGDRELDRLPITGALWSAIGNRTGGGIGQAPTTDPTASIDQFVTALFAGTAGAYRLSAQQIVDPVENPANLDLLKLNFAEATLVTATVLPSSVSPPYATVTFYVRSPLNDPRYTLEAVARLLFAGANVVLVKEDDSISPPPRNTISFLDSATGDEAKQFADLLGPVDVAPFEQRIDGVGVVLTLGTQFLQDADLERDNAPTTVPGADAPFTSDPNTTDDENPSTSDTLTEEG